MAAIIDRLSEAQSVRDATAAQLEQIQARMNNPPVVYTAPEREIARQDPQIAALEQVITQIKARIRGDRERYGAGHAQIERFEARLRAHEQERDALMADVLERNLRAGARVVSV
ncbi:MAG: hypothetical protein ACOC0P_06960, partial [Planctomycetota bacterium]